MTASQALTPAAVNSPGQRLMQRVLLAYIDAQLAVLSGNAGFKGSVRAVTTTTLAAYTRVGNVITKNSAGAIGTIDGVADLGAGDFILLKNGAAGADNGIYEITDPGGATAYVLTRRTNFDASSEVKAGHFVFASEGTANGNAFWVLTTDDPIVINSTTLTFTKLPNLSDLASTAAGLGANLVGFQDAGNKTAADDVDEALDEIYVDGTTANAHIDVPLLGGILAAGTPLSAWADNAGASAPGVTLADSKCVGLRWNNFATQTAVWLESVDVPADIDTTVAPTVEVRASKTGATLGDATTFDVSVFAQTDAALHDAGSELGGTTSAMTGNATAKTVQKVTKALASAPAAGASLSLSIKPTNGTLGTDDVIVTRVRFKYTRKLRTA